MSDMIVDDQFQRDQALNVSDSYIVQAPAGSGKTGLLVQRVLSLLSCVDEPEEITAITFTRKAAAEMKDRIIQALLNARDCSEPDNSFERTTWILARKVLEHDKQRQWQLISCPRRLRIQTIDSLCSSIASQMPVLSHFGSLPSITDKAGRLYREAALATIDCFDDDTLWSSSIRHLVAHLDNRLEYLTDLICKMLATRDQWLRHVADPQHPSIDRNNMEQALERLIVTQIEALHDQWPQDLQDETMKLMAISGVSKTLDVFPDTSISSLLKWKRIAALMLTNEGKRRKKLTKNEGFPAVSSTKVAAEKELFADNKRRMQSLLDELEQQGSLIDQLHAVRGLPDPAYSDDEWETLEALFELLRLSVAQLDIVFRQAGEVDFIAMSLAALHALGESEQPTDLALSLDYRISHILVDEFQDTSMPQFSLLEKLTASWQDDDGRTLFLVGDPMQSIYRFREAEVGLFLQARDYGIGSIRLKPLNLSVNFRSQKGIIDWVNDSFRNIFPQNNHSDTGAVSYVDSVACHQTLSGDACQIHALFDQQKYNEAEEILAVIKQTRQRDKNATIAILVRSRPHLTRIIAALKQAQIRFRAVEIEALSDRPVIKDLLALYKAMSSPADRIAWLGVLRAPWCGLMLKDLHVLCTGNAGVAIAEIIRDESTLHKLSEDGLLRLQRVSRVMDAACESMQRKSLRDWVEGCWYVLGGPACLRQPTDSEDAEVFFQLLEQLDAVSLQNQKVDLTESVSRLFALADVEADESLQIMTIHKSKGLEFDTVILPGLGNQPASNDSQLMKWLERPGLAEGNDLLIAPIRKTGADINQKYSLINDFDKKKSRYEEGRLLYVATTRARQYLHLFGHVKCKQNGGNVTISAPASGSLLASLWPAVSSDFEQQKILSKTVQAELELGTQSEQSFCINRLGSDWICPPPPAPLLFTINGEEVSQEPLEFDWAGETAKHIGTVVHHMLQDLSKHEIDKVDFTDEYYKQRAAYQLLSHGINSADINRLVDKVIAALRNTQSDSRGAWILGKQEQARSEYPLTGVIDGEVRHVVIDRTFVDDGVRWIIDYKTGAHSGAGLEGFLDNEQQRYRAQLESYARIFKHIDDRPIRLGLYFPMLKGWREWDFD